MINFGGRSIGPRVPQGRQKCEEKIGVFDLSRLFVRWGHSLGEYLELSERRERFYQAFLNDTGPIIV